MTDYLRIGRRDVKLTHPDKVLFAKAGLTKLHLARHYERVAEVMLPYVRSGRWRCRRSRTGSTAGGSS